MKASLRVGEVDEIYQQVVDAYQSENTIEVIKESSKGANVPAWQIKRRSLNCSRGCLCAIM